MTKLIVTALTLALFMSLPPALAQTDRCALESVLTNPMMMKGPMRELISIGPQTVRVRLPEGRQPRRVRLLAACETPLTEWSRQYLTVKVASILDHEVVAIDL